MIIKLFNKIIYHSFFTKIPCPIGIVLTLFLDVCRSFTILTVLAFKVWPEISGIEDMKATKIK